MNLISSADTLAFLGKSAPRPWVRRMLKWMIYDGELTPYFVAGKIVPRASVVSILAQIDGLDLAGPLAERDAATRDYFNAETAAKLVGRRFDEEVEDDTIEWSETDEPHAVGAGFFVYAEEIDWEAGKISVDLIDPDTGIEGHLFWDADDHLASMFPRASFNVSLAGMCFRRDNIEMLQPGAELHATQETSPASFRARIGRPRSWDWDGAMAHLLSVAQHPDGLPTGPGAQTNIETLIANWFVAATGNSPAPSQIRSYAQKVMRALKSSET